MDAKVTKLYGGYIVEVQHDVFNKGLKGMDAKEYEQFIKDWERCGQAMKLALIQEGER